MASGLPILFLRVLGLPVALAASIDARAAVVQGEAREADGTPVAGTVITLTPRSARPPAGSIGQKTAVVDQKGREFLPHVLAVGVGTDVKFPNSDRIHHHVYSFSPAKRFEIKLYKGTPAEPVRFDRTGVVVLGCNIHDWMVGYVFVTAAPYFATTDDAGVWSLDLPAGDYTLDLWHPDLERIQEPFARSAVLSEGRPLNLHHTLVLKRLRRSGKPPASRQEEDYLGEP
ncbi:MAG: methylamine utilization protein [Pseudomonadota bacterium]